MKTFDSIAPRAENDHLQFLSRFVAIEFLNESGSTLSQQAKRLAPLDLQLREQLCHNAAIYLHDLYAQGGD